MIALSVLSEKGGVGKTTTALSLAVAAVQDGKRAAVIDTDPQATAAKWTDRREAEMPWVVTSPAARLRTAVDQARAQGVEFLVIDTPPHAGADAAQAARLSDVVLIAMEPHLFALETLPKMQDLLKLAGEPLTFVVITKAPTQGRDVQTVTEHIQAEGFDVCPSVLYARAAHRHAGNAGQTAAEFEPSGKAADDIKGVYMYTIQLVEKRSGNHGKTQSLAKRA